MVLIKFIFLKKIVYFKKWMENKKGITFIKDKKGRASKGLKGRAQWDCLM